MSRLPIIDTAFDIARMATDNPNEKAAMVFQSISPTLDNDSANTHIISEAVTATASMLMMPLKPSFFIFFAVFASELIAAVIAVMPRLALARGPGGISARDSIAGTNRRIAADSAKKPAPLPNLNSDHPAMPARIAIKVIRPSNPSMPC